MMTVTKEWYVSRRVKRGIEKQRMHQRKIKFYFLAEAFIVLLFMTVQGLTRGLSKRPEQAR